MNNRNVILNCLNDNHVFIPEDSKGAIGIEIPNHKPQIVGLSNLLQSPEYLESEAQLPIAVGMDVEGKSVVADLATMPHLLIAGATGQGKSVFLNALIVSLLAARTPEELQLLLIDPKMVEFSQYSALSSSYLLKVEGIGEPVITNPENALLALNALCVEMERRYTLLSGAGVLSIVDYNDKVSDKLPYIVVVIDEFADLIMTLGKDFQAPIARLAQKVRAVGIHIVLATQRPSRDVITGVIKACFPARIAFRTTQMTDSNAILDHGDASKLLGRGDMLFSNNGCITRLQGAFIDSSEIDGVVKSLSEHYCVRTSNFGIKGVCTTETRTMPQNDLFDKAVKLLVTQGYASSSLLQRKFRIGYIRACRLMEELEAAGIVGPSRGVTPREILINADGRPKAQCDIQ